MKRIHVSKKIPQGMSQYSMVEPELKKELMRLIGEVTEIHLSGPDEEGYTTVTLETYAMLPEKAHVLIVYLMNMEDQKVANELKNIIRDV